MEGVCWGVILCLFEYSEIRGTHMFCLSEDVKTQEDGWKMYIIQRWSLLGRHGQLGRKISWRLIRRGKVHEGGQPI